MARSEFQLCRYSGHVCWIVGELNGKLRIRTEAQDLATREADWSRPNRFEWEKVVDQSQVAAMSGVRLQLCMYHDIRCALIWDFGDGRVRLKTDDAQFAKDDGGWEHPDKFEHEKTVDRSEIALLDDLPFGDDVR